MITSTGSQTNQPTSAPSAPQTEEQLVEELGGIRSSREPNGLQVGSSFITNMWYFAVSGDQLKRGAMITKIMLNEPILVGRDKGGAVFAMRDICPHQGIPLSTGSFDGCKVECCFHGWKFDTQGVCTDIPSIVENQKFNLCSIKTRSYPCKEVFGSVWVYFGEKKTDLPEVPYPPGLTDYSYAKTSCKLIVPTHIDYAVAALIDPAHVPFVHKSWWWRSAKSLKEKQKLYVPEGSGWTTRVPSQARLWACRRTIP